MKIIVNGKEVEISGKTVAEFVIERNVTGKMFVVEKNGKIIYDHTAEPLNEGDIIELVGFVGGG